MALNHARHKTSVLWAVAGDNCLVALVLGGSVFLVDLKSAI